MKTTIRISNKEIEVEIKTTDDFSDECPKCCFYSVCFTSEDNVPVTAMGRTFPSINEMCVELTPDSGMYYEKCDEKEANYIYQEDIINDFCKTDTCPFHKEPLENTCFKSDVCPFKKLFK